VAKKAPSYAKQVVGSLIAALIITAVVVALVTAKIGPGLDAKELRERERIAEERREERQDRLDGNQGGSGPG
jgi:multisubunit Na+/H+ antiporter MnhC subunit